MMLQYSSSASRPLTICRAPIYFASKPCLDPFGDYVVPRDDLNLSAIISLFTKLVVLPLDSARNFNQMPQNISIWMYLQL